MQRTAQCQCGSLRAIAAREPRINNVCHCRACQRRTGSVISAGAFFLKADVQCEGPSKIYTRRADSGQEVHFHFCPNCGTSVYWQADIVPDFLGIAVGCFADPNFPAPSFSIWEEGRHPWLGLPPGIGHAPLGIGAATDTAQVPAKPERDPIGGK
jgi:hypothetical protein